MSGFAVMIIAGLLVVSTGLAFVPPPADKIVFLDVGQGDSILLQDGSQQILIDGGQNRTVLTRLAEEMPWFDRKIDVVVSTHPDRDHLEGLLHVVERYQVGLIVLPAVPHSSQLQEAWLGELTEAVSRQQIAYRFARPGQELTLNDLHISILGPPEQIAVAPSKTNNASVISRVEIHGLSLLLTGDAETAAEKNLVATQGAKLDVDILKAGHHGSKTSTSPELLQATTPSFVAISVGKDNRYGHPHPTVLARLNSVTTLRTDQLGSIRFQYQKTGWNITCGSKDLFTFRAKSCTTTNS